MPIINADVIKRAFTEKCAECIQGTEGLQNPSETQISNTVYLTVPFVQVVEEEDIEVNQEKDSLKFLLLYTIMLLTTNLVVYL